MSVSINSVSLACLRDAQSDKFTPTFVNFFLWRYGPTQATAASFLRFLDHTNDSPQSVGLLWTSDQLVAQTST